MVRTSGFIAQQCQGASQKNYIDPGTDPYTGDVEIVRGNLLHPKHTGPMTTTGGPF